MYRVSLNWCHKLSKNTREKFHNREIVIFLTNAEMILSRTLKLGHQSSAGKALSARDRSIIFSTSVFNNWKN